MNLSIVLETGAQGGFLKVLDVVDALKEHAEAGRLLDFLISFFI